MSIHRELKKMYSALQRDYCKMLNTIKHNDINDNINNDIIELSHLLVLITNKLDDINMKTLLHNNYEKNDNLLEYEENQQILDDMLPLFLLLKMQKQMKNFN